MVKNHTNSIFSSNNILKEYFFSFIVGQQENFEEFILATLYVELKKKGDVTICAKKILIFFKIHAKINKMFYSFFFSKAFFLRKYGAHNFDNDRKNIKNFFQKI